MFSRWLKRGWGEAAHPAERGARRRGLLDINHFVIDADVVAFTVDRLAERGRECLEAFVLWGGKRQGEKMIEVSGAIFPQQTSVDTDDGLFVIVDDNALFEVNKFFYEHREVLCAQVHTHPGEAFHSATDDALPMATLVGALSIVIPNFARVAHEYRDDWAWYRLSETGRWTSMSRRVRIEYR